MRAITALSQGRSDFVPEGSSRVAVGTDEIEANIIIDALMADTKSVMLLLKICRAKVPFPMLAGSACQAVFI